MIEIRPLHEDEIEAAKVLVPHDCAEPDWKACWAVLDGKELVGVFGMESRLIVEPLYMKPRRTLHAYGAMVWIDGFLREIARQHGKSGYEFFVQDSNAQFQDFIEKHLPVSKGREKSGLYFFRKFEG